MPGSKPRAITPALTTALCDALSHGLPLNKAAALVRLAPRTVDRWLAKGRDSLDAWAQACEELPDDATSFPELDVYGEFFLDAAEAIAKREIGWLKAIEAHDGKGQNWTRHAWLLERTSPGDYGLKDGVQRVALAAGQGKGQTSEVPLNAVALVLIQAGKEAAGLLGAAADAHPVVDQPADGDAGPRRGLPAAR